MKRICAVVISAFLAVQGLSAQLFCWNLENYFDCKDDPATADEAFTPGGEHRWTRRKMVAKRNLIAKTIIASASCFGGETPSLVGLCEVENEYVLKTLTEDTPLAKIGYKVLHRDSGDPRGIDVALLYDPSRIHLLSHEFITIADFSTRDILYAKVAMPDTLHVFVNHWPSKYSGAKASETRRLAVAAALEATLDSLYAVDSGAKIVVMGDFNATPEEPSIKGLCERARLQNLSAAGGGGTIRFKGKWELIDHLLASPAAAQTIGSAKVFKPAFLLEDDKTFMGKKPRRTHVGPRYNGGVSDHLPIIADIC